MGEAKPRLDPRGRAVGGLGLGHLAELFVNSTQINLAHHGFRLKPLGHPILFDSLGQSARLLQRPAQTDMQPGPLLQG